MPQRWSRAGRVIGREAVAAVLLAACGAFSACGGSSQSERARGGGADAGGNGGAAAGSGGAAAGSNGAVAGSDGGASAGSGPASGRGGAGASASGGDGGTGAEPNGGAGVAAGAVGGSLGPGGETGSGAGGTGAAAGGAAGDAGAAGDSSGGACHDLCSVEQPACCTEALRCVERVPRCRLDVLAERVDVINEYAELEAEVAALPGTLAFSLDLANVERAAAEASPAARFELTLSASASSEFAGLAALDLNPFRLSCDERELFVGVIYDFSGAAAQRTPVLHVEAEDDVLVLRLGAWQGAWLFGGSGEDGELRARLDRSELRATFCGRGILGEIP